MAKILNLGSRRTPEDYITYDFGDVALDIIDRHVPDDHKYDYLDLLETPRKFHNIDPDRTEYNFGDKELDPDNFNRFYLEKLFIDAISVATNMKISGYSTGSNESPAMPQVCLQYYYNPINNKTVIEYKFNTNFMDEFKDWYPRIVASINSFIHGNYAWDVEIWDEIVAKEDGTHEMVDSYYSLSPYTIGYWESLYGGYRFIADDIQIMVTYAEAAINDHPEFFAARDALASAKMKDNFNEFMADLDQLYKTYNIMPDQRANKKFEDFIEAVKNCRDSYKRKPDLTEDQKQEYLTQYNNIYAQYYSSDPERYKQEMHNLNQTYNIPDTDSSYSFIPEMFEDYKTIYRNFFGKDLSEFKEFVVKDYLSIDTTGANPPIHIHDNWYYVPENIDVLRA